MKYHNIEKDNQEKKADKKVIGGSFFTSVLLHGVILLAIGGIVIVPAAVKHLMPITEVAPPPVTLPEPPPMVDQTQPDQSSSDNNGLPSSEPAEAPAATQESSAAPENLVVQDTSSMSPRINAGAGMDTSGISGDLFSHGKGGNGNGDGTGTSLTGPGIRRSTFFGTTGGGDAKGLLQGIFYSIYFDKNGVELPQYPNHVQILIDFVKAHGSPNVLSPYWKSKQVYHATHVVIPGIPNHVEFEAFGENQPKLTRTDIPAFLLHYRGRIAAPEDMTFRFAGSAYGGMVILIDGALALVVEEPDDVTSARLAHQPSLKSYKNWFNWESPDEVLSVDPHPEQIKEGTGLRPFYTFGTWLTWKAKEFHRIDILLGGLNTGILIQEKDKTYKTLPTNIPVLPVFQVDRRENYSSDFIRHSQNYLSIGGCDLQIYDTYGIDPDQNKGPLFISE